MKCELTLFLECWLTGIVLCLFYSMYCAQQIASSKLILVEVFVVFVLYNVIIITIIS